MPLKMCRLFVSSLATGVRNALVSHAGETFDAVPPTKVPELRGAEWTLPIHSRVRTLAFSSKDGGNSTGSGDVFSQVLGSSSENLLADDSERLAEVLVSCGEGGGQRVDIIVDNAGSFAWGLWQWRQRR